MSFPELQELSLIRCCILLSSFWRNPRKAGAVIKSIELKWTTRRVNFLCTCRKWTWSPADKLTLFRLFFRQFPTWSFRGVAHVVATLWRKRRSLSCSCLTASQHFLWMAGRPDRTTRLKRPMEDRSCSVIALTATGQFGWRVKWMQATYYLAKRWHGW